ncbi:MAG TPA: hypothetical protein VJV23_05095 [Candidatus Polarisedimenticolia bacterium]|nr:hypothetical protein [Candidatus Polarisedimenticolia bacterium]
MRRSRRKAALGGLALALSLPLSAASAPSLADDISDIVWMRIEVTESGRENAKVKINLPLSLIEVVVDSIDSRDFMAEIESKHSLDIPKLWREIRRMEVDEFLTIETDGEDVKVWKDRDDFRINIRSDRIRSGEDGDSQVQVTIPLEIMDYVFEGRRKDFRFQEMVDRLRGRLPVTLVRVDGDREQVRIWLEER